VKKLLGGFVAVKLVGATALATTTSAEARLEELGVRVRGAKGGASISAFLLGFVFGS
jgi:hypothetical protein